MNITATLQVKFGSDEIKAYAEKLGISRDIETIGQLILSLLNDEMTRDFPSDQQLKGLPSFFKDTFTPGFAESGWLFAHIGRITNVEMSIQMLYHNDGIGIVVTFDGPDKNNQRYRFKYFEKGFWNINEDRNFKKK